MKLEEEQQKRSKNQRNCKIESFEIISINSYSVKNNNPLS